MFIHDEEVVASSNEELFFRSKKFDLDIHQEKDKILILSACLVVDRLFDRTYESFDELFDPDDE